MKAWRWVVATGMVVGLQAATWTAVPPALAKSAAASRPVRIGVAVELSSVLFSGSVPYHLVHNGKAIATVNALDAWQVRPYGNSLVFANPKGGKVGPLSGRVQFRPAKAGGNVPLAFAQDRWFRGALEFLPGGGETVTAVNTLSVEEYLFGVVPGEMPATWEGEALKAQAIAARTYALHNIGKEASKGYDLCRTTHCQVYDGAAVETAASNEAVTATAGEFLAYHGKPIQAYFHASSGGYTDNAGDVWSEDLPYIRAVVDFDQASPRHVWHLTYSDSQVAAALDKLGVNVGRVSELRVLDRTPVGRVKMMRATGSAGQATFEAKKLRFAIGLHSTFFNVGKISASQAGAAGGGTYFQFAGRGWGHGLGMSQWGARGLAEKGFNYKQILQHFYPGSQLLAPVVTASL